MNKILSKTFGGLSKEYYFRNFIFGLIFPAIFYFAFSEVETASNSKAAAIKFGFVIYIIINTFLYPYSRFVYEKVMEFIFGNNVFFVNAMLLLITKFITMYLCWGLSLFIAPIGLVYLYFYHSKNEN